LQHPPRGVIVASSAKLPPPLKYFAPGARAKTAEHTPHILFPPDGARLELAAADGTPAPVPLKVTGGVAPLTVLVNGVPVTAQPRGSLFFAPPGPGFARVTVVDGAGAVDSVMVRLEAATRASTPAPLRRP